MFVEIEYPDKLLPAQLDDYLSKGWFRMRQTIFTTNFLHFRQQFYSAIWLRIPLENYSFDKKHIALLKQNKIFRTEIKKTDLTQISPQHELLFQQYRQSVSFDVSFTLKELLIGSESYNIFNTYHVNVYYDNTLIAAGFMDIGNNSAAGITCIYHPAYKKYSLGKYLMYLKIDYCKSLSLQYFYPGYVVPGYTPFDYKASVGKATLQYLQIATKQWFPYADFTAKNNPMLVMVEQLKRLQQHLNVNKIPTLFLYYKFFDANLDLYYFSERSLDFPVFLICFPEVASMFYKIIVFDICLAKYCYLQCSSIINTGFQQDESNIFDADLLIIDRQIFSAESVEEMTDHFKSNT